MLVSVSALQSGSQLPSWGGRRQKEPRWADPPGRKKQSASEDQASSGTQRPFSQTRSSPQGSSSVHSGATQALPSQIQIGRASCREREQIPVVAGPNTKRGRARARRGTCERL